MQHTHIESMDSDAGQENKPLCARAANTAGSVWTCAALRLQRVKDHIHSSLHNYLDQFTALRPLCGSKTSACFASRSSTLSPFAFFPLRLIEGMHLVWSLSQFSIETTINIMSAIIAIITIINTALGTLLYYLLICQNHLKTKIKMNLLNWRFRSLAVPLVLGAGVAVHFVYSEMPMEQWALSVNCLSVQLSAAYAHSCINKTPSIRSAHSSLDFSFFLLLISSKMVRHHFQWTSPLCFTVHTYTKYSRYFLSRSAFSVRFLLVPQLICTHCNTNIHIGQTFRVYIFSAVPLTTDNAVFSTYAFIKKKYL